MKQILFALGAIFLTSCGEPATTEPDSPVDDTPVIIQDRFHLYESKFGHAETLARLLQSLDRRDLTVFVMVDHQAGATSVDLEMPASTVVIFGNPRGGTPLMIAEPLLGAELPLRALVYEDEDKIMLAMTGSDYLKREYNLDAEDRILKRLKQALETIATEVTSD